MVGLNLGRLEQVPLRDIWTTEDRDFTPWLAQEENLKLLGDTIGIELELEAQEKEVGPFSADILCKDTADDSWVLVENQLERTDHTHLGQLLTYAGGLQAVTIVWIARNFTDEHRAALDWLNEITDDKFRFFGLEIEVWKIGESGAAPKFNIVSKPNDWFRDVTKGASQLRRTELTETKKTQLDFWTAFKGHIDGHEMLFKCGNPRPDSWMNISVGRSGFNIGGIASFWDSVKNSGENHELRADLYIDGINAKAHYQALELQREDIEKALDRQLTWHNPSNARACRIGVRKVVDLNDRDRWEEYLTWLASEINEFYRYFRPIIRNLEP